MVAMPMQRALYPADWEAISLRIRERAGWRCEACGVAIREGFHFIGIEREAEYVAISQARIAHALREKPQSAPVVAASASSVAVPRAAPAKRRKQPRVIVGPTLWDEVSA